MANPDVKTRPASVLEDPSAKAVASVYAEAYLNAARSRGVENPLEEFTSFQDDVLAPNPDFFRLLSTEATSRDEKAGIIDRVVKPRASEMFTHFLMVLARHDRLDLLPEPAPLLRQLLDSLGARLHKELPLHVASRAPSVRESATLLRAVSMQAAIDHRKIILRDPRR